MSRITNLLRAAAAIGIAASAAIAADRPNVLFLMTDEHSVHALGCYGNPLVKTPALDALAKRGVLFTAAYCQDPICVPSRASFVTGRMGSRVGVFDNSGGLRPDVPTLADAFKEAGYRAVWLGKQHWGGKVSFDDAGGIAEKKKKGGERASTSRLPEDAHVTAEPVEDEYESRVTEQALSVLKMRDGTPFFLGVSFPKPHFPFIVQQPYFDLYKDAVDLPRVTPEMIAALPKSSVIERERYGHAKLTDDQIRKARAVYLGMITFVDGLFGTILAELDRQGLRDNTIILYTADHGELAGEHGLWYKNSFYEAAVRVPFLWSYPKALPRDVRIGAPVMNMDIFPTLCELCGVKAPAGLEGSSLVPLMLGREDGMNRVALSENYRNGMPARMIRSGRWKYCYHHDDREQLFDLESDPGEEKNLVSDTAHRETAASLRTRALEGWSPDDYLKLRAGKKKGAGAGSGTKAKKSAEEGS